MNILIVDDDEMNRKILQTILEDAGFTTLTAEDGQEALDWLEKDPTIGIILLDRMMPRMDGMTFMKHFHKRFEWQDKAVIMQTAANQPKDVIEGNATGLYYYLTKPFEGPMVLSVVRSAIAERESRMEASA